MVARALTIFAAGLFTLPCRSAEPVGGESLRREVLRAAFPKLTIQLETSRFIDDSWRPNDRRKDLFFPDVLAAESVYLVTGPPVDDLERCAAENLQTETASRTRELRMRLYGWPGVADKQQDLLAILQYKFIRASPAGSCWSVARLLHVRKQAHAFQIAGNVYLDSTHHTAINGIEVVDLDGDGIGELVIESNRGGGGTVGSDLIVFSLKEGGFRQWLNVPSRLHEWIEREIEYEQVLDVPRTVSKRAKQFCFTKTVFIDGKRLEPPRIAQPCYPRLTGPSVRNGLLPHLK